MAQFNLELCSCVVVLAVFLPLASGACVDFDLGMGSGTIPDNNINASSVESASTAAKNGRLNYSSGSSWCAGTSDTNPYLQIDLQTLHIVCAVSTQGNSQVDQWVKNYTLQLSIDGTTWTDYKEGGQIKILIGNDDKNSEVKHVLYGVLTRYLRIRPQNHQGGVCMRIEVFGVKQKPTCDSQPIGLASGGRIPDDSFSATSIYSSTYAAKYGRLNGTRAWAAETNSRDDYLQIDLLYEYVICAVATQGNPPTQSPTAQEWTTEYKLRFSLNGTSFFPYSENKADKAFPGNSGKTDTVKNSLKEFASAKFIRFLPTKYNVHKALRVEAYGILLSKVPSQPPTAFQLTASSSTSITASWQLPPVFARHGNIAGFKLFYKKKSSSGSATTLPISDGAILSRTVRVLDKYTEYEFQVLAFTSDGDGPKSLAKVKRTMEDAPSQPPSNFNVTPTSSTGARASWQLPPANSRNGIIKGFKLFYKRKDSSDSGTILLINSESILSKNVNGLYKYTEYEFQVLAFTSAGDGVNSSVVVKRTKEDVPSQPPSGFTLAATTSESITASWQLPPKDSRNGIIIGYKLFYKEKGSSGAGSSKLINSQATRSQEVTGLDKYTEYEFQILAFTSVGDGPKSRVIYEKTKEAAPSQPPSQFNVTVESSTSITASWRLPSEGSRHGIIKGYKLFYKKKGSDSVTLTLNNTKTSETVTELEKYTKYEFKVLAFTSAGDGPNSSTVFKTTMEDAPDAPTSLSYTDLSPSKSHGPRITLTWSEPAERNGVIKSYTLFYSHDGLAPREISGIGKAALSHTVDVLGGVTYQFNVRAVTIKPGKNATKTVTTKEYAPGAGPERPSSAQVNKTTFNISWEPLLREKSYGKVILYEVKAIFSKKGNLRKRSVIYSPSVNTSVTFVVLSDLELCSRYNVSVRAYTAEGPGPYGQPLELETSRPEAPGEFKITDFGTKQITLAWKQYDEKEKIVYTVEYTGTKSYNKTFRDERTIEAINATTQKVEGLIPGTTYKFRVHGTSVCGESASEVVSKMTDMMAPEAPHPHNITDVEVSQTVVDICLWPVEQKYGPVSAYQVIVLKTANGVKELPDNYDSKLKASSDAKKENMNFYIAAEIENDPLLSKPQKFTVGDGHKTKEFVNEELEKGENYIVYERALTKAEKGELKGNASIVAKISITSTTTDKPHVNDLPERTITAVGELAVLTCDVSGDLEASVTWTKDGLTSIPRAQFKNSGKILIIQDVVPGDSGVYECKAMNLFGESRTSTVLIIAVPPRIMEELSPTEVICEKQTPCFLSCQASSYIPFNYSWTKDGQVPTSDNIKLMNNSIIVTPRDRQDYGEYVCHATNSFGSTEYIITLLSPKGIPRSIFLASVIALCCAVVVFLIIICGLIWQRRRAVPSERIQGKEKVDFHGVKTSPDRQSNDEQASDPNTYMELKARLPNHKQSHVPTEYQSLQEVPMNPEYYNMVLQKEIGGKQNEEVYEEI